MIYKQGGISLDINARKSSAQSTNIQFFTQDTGSAKLSFSFTKDGVPLPLSAVDAKIVLLYADDSFYKRSLTLTDKVNGKAEYVLSDEELKHYGEVKAEIKLYYTNGQALATVFFTFYIEKTLEDQNIVPVAEYYVDDFETLRAGINKTVAEISQTLDEIKAKFAEFENIETKNGATEKANKAEANAKEYTDKGVASAKEYTDTHATNTDIHITAAERDKWNEAESRAESHANNKTIHVTTAERTKWNNAQLYKLTQDNGVRILIPDGTDLPPGFYYGINNRLPNNPAPDDAGWFNYDIMDGNSGRKTIIATASYHNKMWFATIHTNGDFRGWKRILTSTDFEPVWTEVPLKNGAKHGARKVMCAVVGGFLCLKGEIITNRGVIFGTLPASYRPDQLRSRLVPIFGTTGMTKLYIETNGNMRLEGQIADKSDNITSYGLDEIIPL
ncbi:phage baseplate upper protein [Bacillus paralicheniformis]|uniref:Phage baseplate upper protein n=1 Tax=Bacillus paralicheniformis TaxID=1648923 RepID=A0AAW6KCE6_9BACI|nr:phage baseplate upper protein [Bacillus paralicheniformis]MDE1453260.1 phage baseplate upper protein [Bacillus paralicheniformis]